MNEKQQHGKTENLSLNSVFSFATRKYKGLNTPPQESSSVFLTRSAQLKC